jgi:hypothetical protein
MPHLFLDELGELGVGDLVGVDGEARDLDLPHGALAVHREVHEVLRRAHVERTPWDLLQLLVVLPCGRRQPPLPGGLLLRRALLRPAVLPHRRFISPHHPTAHAPPKPPGANSRTCSQPRHRKGLRRGGVETGTRGSREGRTLPTLSRLRLPHAHCSGPRLSSADSPSPCGASPSSPAASESRSTATEQRATKSSTRGRAMTSDGDGSVSRPAVAQAAGKSSRQPAAEAAAVRRPREFASQKPRRAVLHPISPSPRTVVLPTRPRNGFLGGFFSTCC